MASISNIFIDQGALFNPVINDSTGSALATNYTAIAQIRVTHPLRLLVYGGICFTAYRSNHNIPHRYTNDCT